MKAKKSTTDKPQHLLRRLFGYLKPYTFILIVSLLFAGTATCFTVAAPAVMGEITTALFTGVQSGFFDWNLVVMLLLALSAFYVIGQLFSLLQNYWMSRVTVKAMQKIRNEIEEKMQRLPLQYYDSKNNGEILSVITNDVDTLQSALGQNLTQIVTQLITIIGIFIMMSRISWVLTIIAVLLVPLSIAASFGSIKISGSAFAKQQELTASLNGCIEEMYNGQNVIQLFNAQSAAKDQFNRLNHDLEETAYKASVASGSISPVTSLVNNLGYVLSAFLGCLFVLRGQMSLGNVQAMLQYSKQFSQPFVSITGMAGAFGQSYAAAKRVFSLLDAQEETQENEDILVNADENSVKGKVEFKNVSFGYPGGPLLMKNVNFTILPGQKAAIVGPTGAGKTTLINLLMRFYEINGGEILVDGISTKKMSRKQLRERFGMVLQDTWLFEGTIQENLSYAKEGITHPQILEASKAAATHDFIKALPDGYDMILDAKAENISQGEKQLLTIARAMAADPSMMILDEATSNVDAFTEKKIQSALSRLMKNRTSFVIAHRLSTIQDADVILYMENGDILETGSHEQLMKRNGKYASLYNSQFV